MDTFSWEMQQYNWEDEIDDYFDRVWVYNSMEFSIADDAVFIVEADGSKRIENFAVSPRENVPENFDLGSDDGFTGIGNLFAQPFIDPWGIGRIVNITFSDSNLIPRTTYTSEDFADDFYRKVDWAVYTPEAIAKIALGQDDFVHGLFDDGVTKFLDENKPIIYGSPDADSLVASDIDFITNAPPFGLNQAPLLAPFRGNGLVLIAGNGDDTVKGLDRDDRILGGKGNDNLDGGLGDDTFIGGAGNDTIKGGSFLFGLLQGTDTAVYRGALSEYDIEFLPDDSIRISDKVAGRDGSDTLVGVEFAEFSGKLIDLVAQKPQDLVELPAYAHDAKGGFNQATAQGTPPYTDPLVLDLDGDGIELTSVDNHLVLFDVDADGFREATGWVHSDDGLLVLDRNGDGLINDISELFGNQTTSGFVALRGIDSNADGFIDTADPKFSDLQVWRDLDSDGRTDGNELFSLDELGISRIRTAASSTNITNAGNQITETSHFELADGSQREIANVGFSVEQLNSYYDPYSTLNSPVVFTAEILSLPNLRGYGNLSSLQIAMATDEQLLARVRSFTEEMSGDVASAGGRIRSILLRWAGVDGTAPTSRGSNVNAQELGFLEKFLGSSYPQNLTITAAAGQTLSQTYKQLASTLGTRLIAQAALVPVEYDASSDQLVFNGDKNAAVLQLEQVIAQSVSSPSAQLDLEISVLKQLLSEQEEWILGNGASEQLVGSTGEDRLYGFSGNDTLGASGGNDLLEGGEGNDNLDGGMGSDTLTGGVGNDSLNGYEGNDTYRFTRGDGQDVIHDLYQPYYLYDGGTDTLVFGEGITLADLSWSFDGTNLTLSVAGSSDQVTIRNITDTRQQIEQFVIAGETLSLSQVLTSRVGTGTTGADNLTWGQSAIFLDGLAGDDSISTGDYADKLSGSEGNDTLIANGGNDLLESGVGNDSLNGGTGSDTLTGGVGNDSLNGGEGNDTYRFTRGDGQDVIHDFYQPYYIEPGGTDTLVFDGGITRADLSWSFDGTNLTLSVAGSSDQITIRSITDTRHQIEQFVLGGETLSLNEVMTNWVGTGTTGADNLTWNQSAVVLDGLTGNDTITTGNYADKLYGGDGNDSINSNAGDDTLDGGAGNDTLSASFGNDSLMVGLAMTRLMVERGTTV